MKVSECARLLGKSPTIRKNGFTVEYIAFWLRHQDEQ